MATSVLSRKKGVIVGDDVLKLFDYAQQKKFAIPAIVSLGIYKATVESHSSMLECHFLLHRRCRS